MRQIAFRITAAAALVGLATLATPTQPQAQSWPQRPVRLIVPLGQPLRQEPRADVGACAGPERHDQPHWPLRPALRLWLRGRGERGKPDKSGCGRYPKCDLAHGIPPGDSYRQIRSWLRSNIIVWRLLHE